MKKIYQVRVIPNAKIKKVLSHESSLKVWLNTPAEDGKANKALIEILAKYFNVQKNNIHLLHGEKNRIKRIAVSFD